MARREWEALSDGPFKGTVQILPHDHWLLSIPLHVELNGVSKEAVAQKLKTILDGSALTGVCSPYDVQEWNEMKRIVVSFESRRLRFLRRRSLVRRCVYWLANVA